ncbi:MAG: hypothetical protein AAB074_16095 [Planctomycetota bacterium]
MKTLATVASLALVISAAAEPPAVAPKPKGDRALALSVTMPREGDYAKEFEEAQKAGLRHNVLSFDWADLETAEGEYKPATNFLVIANAWYPPRKVPVHLMVRPIHTNQDARPAFRKGKAFDDPEVIAAFKRLLDWVFAQVPDLEVPSFSIGSESDLWLEQDDARWKAFGTFLKEAAAHARKLRPGLKVASEFRLAGIRGSHSARLKGLLSSCDVAGVSDYPIDDQTIALDPAAVRATFKDAVAFAGKKPVYFYQLGYPSGAGCKSSEEKQATFIREVFAAWDQHEKAVAFVNTTWTTDIPAAAVEGYTKYYQFDTPAFRDFLGSLGLRHEDGKPKPAWEALRDETKKRGW